MQASDIPGKLPVPFGNAAGGSFIRAIPVASQIGISDGAASLTDGFPPLTFQPIASGGIPVNGRDMNGILFEISGWTRWVAAGGPITFDSGFSTLIGGYPKGAVLKSTATDAGFWVSLIDNNTANPDSTPANWLPLAPVPASTADLIAGTSTVKYATPAALLGLRATTAEILAGSDIAKYLTPAAFFGARASEADVAAGTDDHKYVTPLALKGSSTPGVIYHPGGIIQQYGKVLATYFEAFYTVPFNTPFPTAVDTVVLTSIQNINDFGHTSDIWSKWAENQTTLSAFVFANPTPGGGPTPNRTQGISWMAFGR